jgi:uncharacterized membrane protein YkgB
MPGEGRRHQVSDEFLILHKKQHESQVLLLATNLRFGQSIQSISFMVLAEDSWSLAHLQTMTWSHDDGRGIVIDVMLLLSDERSE